MKILADLLDGGLVVPFYWRQVGSPIRETEEELWAWRH